MTLCVQLWRFIIDKMKLFSVWFVGIFSFILYSFSDSSFYSFTLRLLTHFTVHLRILSESNLTNHLVTKATWVQIFSALFISNECFSYPSIAPAVSITCDCFKLTKIPFTLLSVICSNTRLRCFALLAHQHHLAWGFGECCDQCLHRDWSTQGCDRRVEHLFIGRRDPGLKSTRNRATVLSLSRVFGSISWKPNNRLNLRFS